MRDGHSGNGYMHFGQLRLLMERQRVQETPKLSVPETLELQSVRLTVRCQDCNSQARCCTNKVRISS